VSLRATATGQATLASRVRERLRDQMRDGVLGEGAQLAPEVELAASLGVSRTTVREALVQLEQEGLLIRRHGHGTFVRSGGRLRGSLNANESATELIRSHGMEPLTSHARMTREPAAGPVARALGLVPGTTVIRLERVRTADRRPVVFTIDWMPAALFDRGGVDPQELLDPGLSLYRLYADRLGCSVVEAQASISLARADEVVAERLAMPVGGPLLRLEQVDATVEGEPVLFSIESYLPGTFEFTVHRRGPALDAMAGRQADAPPHRRHLGGGEGSHPDAT
jgi:GntR family transcriptional regulator